MQVTKYVTEELKLLNSYDTWHGNEIHTIHFVRQIFHKSVDLLGTKNVAKQMNKVSCGTQKAAGKTWFPELSDKRMFLLCVLR